MNSETTITIGLVIAVIGCLIGIWNFFKAYKENVTKDVKSNDSHFEEINQNIKTLTESVLKLNFKSDQICATTNETRTDLKSMRNDIEDIREKQIRHDMEIKAIWKRLESIDGE